MFLDGRTIPSDETLTCDVCVVGAGPAGIVVADQLSKEGVKVLLLERGADEWNAKDRAETVVNAGLDYDVSHSTEIGFGGTANAWPALPESGGYFARFRELDDSDFTRREWVPHSGWPFGKAYLRPFYDQAWSVLGFDDLPPRLEDVCRHGSGVGLVPAGGDLLKSLFIFAPRMAITEKLKNDLARSEAATVVTHSTLVDIRCDDSPHEVSSMRVATRSSTSFTVRARLFVLAAGAIESARSMLSSQSRYPQGLGNQHGLVGRFFMEHPHFTSGVLYTDDPGMLTDPAVYSSHAHGDTQVKMKYALAEHVLHEKRLLNSSFRLAPQPLNARSRRLYYGESASRSLRAASNLRRAATGHRAAADTRREIKSAIKGLPHIARYGGSVAVDRLGERLRAHRPESTRAWRIDMMAEQTPNRDSRVELADHKDRFGVPVARLDWRVLDRDIASYERSQEEVGRALSAAGYRVDSVVQRGSFPHQVDGGHHHMGTTRMATVPQEGVVDADCRVHGITNLYVSGSSVFPTGGYANPSLTLIALAFRVAEHCKESLRSEIVVKPQRF